MKPTAVFARYFVDDLKRWQHFRGRELNSHAESVPGYRSMYGVFEPMRKSLRGETDVDDPSATKH